MKPGPRAISIAITLALHAVAVLALLQFDAVRGRLLQAVPIMINLITPPPKVEPPRPRPVARAPAPVPQPMRSEPPPVLVAESVAPGPVLSVPSPIQERVPAAAPVLVARAPAPLPPPIVAPVFDAAYLQNPAPAYPLMSRRRNEQGRVLLRVFVSTAGTAERIEVRESSGHERLDGAARDAVLGWRFVPARQGEKPVAAWVLVPITFSLGG